MKVQKYECRLRRAGVLTVADVASERVIDAESAAAIGTRVCAMLPHEQVWALLLTADKRVRGLVRLAEGGLHGCALTPADVLRPVLVSGSSAFLLFHNHPSGDPNPSPSDWAMTRALGRACEVVGLSLLDHLVVTQAPARYRSMREIDDGAFSGGES